jgi:hypothetical protein
MLSPPPEVCDSPDQAAHCHFLSFQVAGLGRAQTEGVQCTLLNSAGRVSALWVQNAAETLQKAS